MRSADHSYFLSPPKAQGKKYFFQEWNPSQKTVMLFIHGFPGCSDHAKLMTSSDLHHAFRIVAIDRPGYGQSDFQAGISPLQFAEQVVEMLAELEIEKIRLLSVSGGAPYSMAIAHLLKDRVEKNVFYFWGRAIKPAQFPLPESTTEKDFRFAFLLTDGCTKSVSRSRLEKWFGQTRSIPFHQL